MLLAPIALSSEKSAFSVSYTSLRSQLTLTVNGSSQHNAPCAKRATSKQCDRDLSGKVVGKF